MSTLDGKSRSRSCLLAVSDGHQLSPPAQAREQLGTFRQPYNYYHHHLCYHHYHYSSSEDSQATTTPFVETAHMLSTPCAVCRWIDLHSTDETGHRFDYLLR